MSLIAKIIWQVEMQLQRPTSLDDLADRCAVSPFHMARVFRMATGHAPMTYLRARRLSHAAGLLAQGDRDVLQIALDLQYGSHAAFTRAFVSYFGVNPRDVRKVRSTKNLQLMEPLKMDNTTFVDVSSPTLIRIDAMRIVGISAQCTFEDAGAIPGLWQQFNAREDEVAAAPGPAFGVCCDADGAGRFRYVAGMQAATDAPVPDGMDVVTVPACEYAVFQHSGHIADLPKTVHAIWNKALPESGLTHRAVPDFECYDQRFDVETGRGTVEIWIPVIGSERSN